jgi:cyclopropane-fatty-acyl-phospholipid synthase
LRATLTHKNSVRATHQVEWGSNGLGALFAHKRNAVSPQFLRMVADLPRFETEVLTYLAKQAATDDAVSLGDWLAARRFTASFTSHYLVPVCSSIWSTPGEGILQADALTILSFLRNHHMLQLFNRPQWLTVKGRSVTYVDAVVAHITASGGCVRTNTRVAAVQRGNPKKGETASVTLQGGDTLAFDAVIVACHAPDALTLLGKGATIDETAVLSAFQYSTSDVYLHRDAALMPRSRAAWSAWNFLSEESSPGGGVCLTYWLNALQTLGDVPFSASASSDQQQPPPVLVTLNPAEPPKHVVAAWKASHPIPSRGAAMMKRRMPALNEGAFASGSAVYFAGAYCGFGFHEDGIVAGFTAARLACGKTAAQAAAQLLPYQPQLRLGLVDRGAKAACCAFLGKFITVGELILRESSAAPLRFGPGAMPAANGHGNGTANDRYSTPRRVSVVAGADPYDVANACDAAHVAVSLTVNNPAFYWKLATRADMGLCDAYVDGDIEVQPSLFALLQLAIANRDAAAATAAAADAQQRSRAAVSVSARASALTHGILARCGGLVTAAVPAALGYARHLARGNSLTQARRNIAAHYDLSNDLFAAFLSDDMTYSCAIFASPEEPLTTAQDRKLRALADKARLKPGMHVLEIGFGWGSLSLLLAQHYGVHVTGITLSEQQLQLATERVNAAGLAHLITFQLCDYRAHEPQAGRPAYDAIISCEMLEAVGHEYLPAYFHHVARLLAPSGIAVIQVITTPEGRYDVYRTSTDFIKEYIFPGCCCPSLTAVLAAAGDSNLTLGECEDIGPHYAPTLLRWRDKFMAAQGRITADLGFSPAFIRAWDLYFQYCAAGFATRTLGDWQLVFSRPGNVRALGNVAYAAEP